MRFHKSAVVAALASVVLAGLILTIGDGRAEETAQPSSQTESAHAGADGFSICPFASSARGSVDSTIGPCQPMTAQAMESFGLSSGQAVIVPTLRDFAVKPRFNPLQSAATDAEGEKRLRRQRSLSLPARISTIGF